MSSEAHSEPFLTAASARWRRSRARQRLRAFRRAALSSFSSSLTRRIVFLNLGGLLVLVVAFLLLNQFRADIIAARTQSLKTQAGIISAAIAASATVETDTITVDPEKLLRLAPNENAEPQKDDEDSIEFSINPERVGPVLHRLVTPTRTRARIYDLDGLLLLDSSTLSVRGPALRSEANVETPPWWQRVWSDLRQSLTPAKKRRAAEEWATNGKSMPEVAAAFAGRTESAVRVDAADETIVSVAAPIQRAGGAIRGALLLSTLGGDIDSVIASERWALLRVFLVLATVMLVLSLLLANTIAEPVRKLAEAAERVRRGIRSRQQIPDFTARSDEIGHLSGALRDMTQALYNRIDAIESFAADVAHELKNPLTSLRSAVETLPRVKSGPSRDRLLDIMQHDVRRLDRLISDISDASRLDAELARGDAGPVDLVEVAKAVAAMVSDSPRNNGVTVKLTVERRGAQRPSDFIVIGHDSRLAQVLTNLIDNACSFSKPGGEVRVALRRAVYQPTAEGAPKQEEVWALVDDDGPGIPPHALERIFERFYTDRPEQGFGQNSGLGLSISRQIVEAHGGRIWAENRPGPSQAANDEAATRHGTGARFVVALPAIVP
ncbi:MAG: stimulus-sensing domain-containing protein [Roseiarcus sp.]|uniref:stimulus-sensing domain-containing protein n=1 Tax=Roseiarcus sp. TaxID=1969460 RepID=UPI003C22C661